MPLHADGMAAVGERGLCMLDAILFDISRATDVGTLNQYQQDARENETLTVEELAAVEAAIHEKLEKLRRRPGS